jgi:teichuronic acid biosynthesis glycosyltransferase TuaG
MSSSLISILIPVYNGVEFLEESLKSVFYQTYKNWEVIIGINGYSPPNFLINNIIDSIVNLMIENYELKNKDDSPRNKVKIICYETIGKPATLNKMIYDCSPNSSYIAILDVDDYWLPKKLEKQIPFLDIFDIVGTKCQYFGGLSHSPNIPTGNLSNYDFFINGNPIINSSALIRKEYAHWNENEYLEDYELWLQLSKEKKKFFNINEILVMHRIHSSSYFNSNKEKGAEELKKFKEKWSKLYYN